MDLSKFLPKSDNRSEPECFWSLIIEPGWVQAGIWRIENKLTDLIYSGNPIAWEADEDLLNAGDSALSTAVQNFPQDFEDPSKTVFGVVSSWVEEGQIKKEYLDKIKSLCGQLSLKPVGFVVISEALANYSKIVERGKLSAIVAGLYKENLEISIFKQGLLLGNTKVARSVSVADDIAEGLSRFTENEELPSKVLLYGGREGELEEVKQELFRVNWEDYPNLKFLHTPKIVIAELKQKLLAISLAGASEMMEVEGIKEGAGFFAEDFDVIGKDSYTSQPHPEDNTTTPKNNNLGKESQDIDDSYINNLVETEENPLREYQQFQEDEKLITDEPKEEVLVQGDDFIKKDRKRKFAPPNFSKYFRLGDYRSKSLNVLNNFSLVKIGKLPLLFSSIMILIAILGGFLAWWFLVKAEITIYVSPKVLNENFQVLIDPNAPSDNYDEKVLMAEVKTATVDGEKSAQTTGVKTVGEKAVGKVVIYRAGTQLTLPQGTIIQGPGGLKFSISDSISLASGSASNPGKTSVSVAAVDIGADYNLASGTSFSVANYSTGDIEAKNESAFSGGSSRQINVVSEDDQIELEKSLADELIEKARQDLSKNLSEDKIILESVVSSSVKSKKFTSKIGDEAKDFKLSLSLEADTLTVNKSSLDSFVYQFASNKIAQGFVLKEEDIDYEAKYIGEKDAAYLYRIETQALLLPEIDTREVGRKLLGYYPEVVSEYLKRTVPGFVKAEVKITPVLPGRLGTLPRFEKNLTIQLSADK